MEEQLKRLEAAYTIMGDGSMTECLGRNCPTSCCRSKTEDCVGGKLVTGRVRLLGVPEIYYQDRIITPSIRTLGVTINLGLMRDRDRHTIIHLLDDCQNPDGSCKMKERKPLRCRMFPLGLNPASLTDLGCPQTIEICNDPELIRKVREVRLLLGID